MNAVKAWSYSAWSQYDTCPLQYKLAKIDKIKTPDSPALVNGRVVHDTLAKYITGDGEDLPPLKSAYHRQLYAEMRAFPADDKVVEQKMGLNRAWRPTGYWDKDIWVRFSWDVALLYEDLTGEIVDHKTGRRYGSNDEQMELFGLSFFCQYKPATHVTTRLIYVDTGEEEIAEFDATQRDALISKWEAKVAPMFNDSVFAPRPNDKCRFCHFSKSKLNLCKFG